MAGGGNAVRGSRVGAGPHGEESRGPQAPRQLVSYFCTQGHHIQLTFSADVVAPDVWDCTHCGRPASQDESNPPPVPRNEPYKTHLAYAKERRSDAEAEAILDEAITILRSRRRAGDISAF